ncbi:MAG: Csu type fimbrial protein [Janthinobacterium lividum]
MPNNLNCLFPASRDCLVYLGVAILLCFTLALPHAASAQTCTMAGPTLTFGTLNPYSGATTTTSGNGTFTCSNSGTSSITIYACLSIGTGTGGTTPINRTLASGASKIPIMIETGGSAGQVGNGTSYPMAGPISVTLTAGQNTTTAFSIISTVPPPSPAPPPGSYTSSFAGADAQFIYAVRTSTTTCASLNSGTHQTTQANFSISATVPTQCSVSATAMAFPTASVLGNPVNTTATVSTTCNAAVPVTIALDNGATGTGPTTRQMKSGANAISYGIYRDAAANLPWGNTSGTDTAALSSGTGTLTAYGRVPAQASPPPGSYSDIVNVIITY